MNRRDFLKRTVEIGGLVAPLSVVGQDRPCPPGRLQAVGGTAVSTACTGSDLQADWLSRARGKGVIWAHRFTADEPDALYWASVKQGSSKARLNPHDGIMGDGCLELFCPAGEVPWCTWRRPLAPVIAETPAGGFQPYRADVNSAGLPAVSYQQFYSMNPGDVSQKYNNYRGGNFGNVKYYDETDVIKSVFKKSWWRHHHPEFVHHGRVWLQFRMKLSASKLDPREINSKLVFPFQTQCGGTAWQSIVMGVRAGGPNSSPDYGWPNGIYYYTSQSSHRNSKLRHPQGGEAPYQHQDEGDYPLCRTDKFGALPDDPAAVCWSYPADEWVTYQVCLDLGLDNPVPDGAFNYPKDYVPIHRDTHFSLKVAERGAKRWVTLCERSDWWWLYGGDGYGSMWDYGRAPFGVNVINFTLFNGGGTNKPVTFDQYSRVDQVILSTEEIPLPAA